MSIVVWHQLHERCQIWIFPFWPSKVYVNSDLSYDIVRGHGRVFVDEDLDSSCFTFILLIKDLRVHNIV